MARLSAHPSEITVELLADHPEYIQPLANLFCAQWPKSTGSVEDQVAQFKSCSNRDHIPLTLVAHSANALLGTVSLLERSVHSHSHLSPWVAALYVLPDARHAGVAMRLVAAAEGWAKTLGYGTVHIGISSAQENYEQR